MKKKIIQMVFCICKKIKNEEIHIQNYNMGRKMKI